VSRLASPFLYALDALRDGLEEFGQPWMVIGGVAVIARGLARLTLDVDASVLAPSASLPRLTETLARHWVVGRIDGALEFAQEHLVLLLHHSFSGVPIDVNLARLPFEEQAIRHAERVDWAGVTIPVPRADDLVIYKLAAARPRDFADAETLLLLHGRSMDVPRVVATVGEFAQALGDSDRVDVLAQLLRRTDLQP
jgi:nucleotidyltransferase AbiEii toxin of type IV toxin-antitoxin system